MHIVKCPFSKGGLCKTEGCEFAPDKIVEQLEEFYLSENNLYPRFSFDSIEVEQSNIEETNKRIFNKIKNYLSDDKKIALIGGDHSITYSAFKAFAQKNHGAGLIIFDAHPDCVEEKNPPTHEDYLRVLISEKIVDSVRVILVGIRNQHPIEKEFLESKKIKTFSMKRISNNQLHDICDGITETINQWPAVYLSVDIDVVDPAFAPGTGYIEPGGLTSRELIYFMQRIKLLKNLKMIDLVEVNPKKDVSQLTSKLAAKILVELC